MDSIYSFLERIKSRWTYWRSFLLEFLLAVCGLFIRDRKSVRQLVEQSSEMLKEQKLEPQNAI
jgi:hypothetical protein